MGQWPSGYRDRMSGRKSYQTEIVIAGGGLAGIVAACEALEQGRRVLLIDKDTREKFGGLAKESFGGVHLAGTPHQRRLGIRAAIRSGASTKPTKSHTEPSNWRLANERNCFPQHRRSIFCSG